VNKTPSLEANRIIMFKDQWGAFSNTILMGMDWDFIMLDVLIITFIQRESQQDPKVQSTVILALLVCFIIDTFFVWLRGYLGRRNLNKKTLADEDFLI